MDGVKLGGEWSMIVFNMNEKKKYCTDITL